MVLTSFWRRCQGLDNSLLVALSRVLFSIENGLNKFLALLSVSDKSVSIRSDRNLART